MDVRLLRALRFDRTFQRERVLVHQNHPRLLYAPSAFSRLFSSWPLLFLIYAAAYQHGISRRSSNQSDCFFSVNRTAKVRQAEEFLTVELGRPVCVETYNKTTDWGGVLRILTILSGALRRRSGKRWVRIMLYLAGGDEQHLISHSVALLLAYADMRHQFQRSRPEMVICISDLTARRIASASAANAENIPVFYWQSHTTHDWQPPFEIDAAVTCGMKGYRNVEKAMKPSGWIGFRGLVQEIIRPTPVPRQPHRIGLALNNYIDLESLSRRLNSLKDEFPNAEFILRPHPNAKQNFTKVARECRLTGPGQDLDSFSRCCDLVFAGNTGLQVEIAARGTPVVHLSELDTLPFDLNGFVAAGCIYGRENAARTDIGEVNAFYAKDDWLSKAAKTLDMPSPPSSTPQESRKLALYIGLPNVGSRSPSNTGLREPVEMA